MRPRSRASDRVTTAGGKPAPINQQLGLRHSRELVATWHEADFGTAGFPAQGTGPWLCPVPLPSPKASLRHPHPGLRPSLPSPQGRSSPPPCLQSRSSWPRYFAPHQHKPNPFHQMARTGTSSPTAVLGTPPGAPTPAQGCVPPLLGHAAGREAGSCSQLQAQQQQPLLFHTSVFLALLCISVQELKLRSLAEVLSVVTALRAVVRHSLSLSRLLVPSLLFVSFFFFSLPPSPKFAAWIRSPCVDTLQLSRQRTKGGRSGSKAWPEPL